MSALLEAEVLTWPKVTSRPMFGLNGLYHGRTIFAALPRTRALDVDNSISLRFVSRSARLAGRIKNDQRIIAASADAKWISFMIESEDDIHDALEWLELAYRAAQKT